MKLNLSGKRVHVVKGHKDPFNELLRSEEDETLISQGARAGRDAKDDSSTQAEDDSDEDEESFENEEEEDEEEEEVDDEEEESEEEDGDYAAHRKKSAHSTHDSEEDTPAEEYADLLVEHGTQEEGIRPLREEGKATPRESDETLAHREKIKEHVILKSMAHGNNDSGSLMKLELLEDPKEKAVFIGRKKSVLQKSGMSGALYLGRVEDDEKYANHKLYLDSLNPHVVFVCGARGSGKSYVLGVVAEELALQNPDVGVVVVDPVGVFWSMRFPNKEEKEVKELPQFDLLPQGLDNLRVFIPEGMKKETPPSTY
ncbi:MAG: hypothetical protein AABY11_03715, partial [archaeon]